jgi:S1-C subfamily serine protease
MRHVRAAVLVLFTAGAAGVMVAAAPTPTPAAEEKPALRDALALQAAIQDAIARAEPSVACVAVSRSNGYRELALAAGLTLPAEAPGRLGEYSAEAVIARLGRTADDKRLDALRRLARSLNLADPNNVPEFYGSGIVLDAAEGLILTNWHVIRDATRVYVRLPGKPGSYADIHAADARADLAVLRLIRKPDGLRAAPLGDGDRLRKGHFVIALSNPFAAGFADGSPSASWGVVSNLRRRAAATGPVNEADRVKPLHQYGTLIQTDARLNLGCSGGALLDLKGDLVGLTTSLAAVSGGETAGGYAVPVNAGMRRVIDVLRRGEEFEYGFLGVGFNATGGNPPDGVRLTSLTLNGPAARAGVDLNDVLLSVNGVPVHDSDDLYLAIGTLAAGSEAKLLVRTGTAEPREARAVVAKLHHGMPVIASRRPDPVFGVRVDWPKLTERADLQTELPAGVAVREVVPDSSADRKGIKPGDVISAVNGETPASPADFLRLARGASAEFTVGDPPRRVKLP